MPTKRRKEIVSLLVLLGFIAVYLLFFRKEPSQEAGTSGRQDRRELAFRHRKPYYTKHARCRMDCRMIDETEVMEILRDGTINYHKSDLKAKPCPSYAVEGITHDRQKVRVVVGNCDSRPSVITVIDLVNEFDCACP
ncbi:MAG: DUF4258 domain-containing protein [Bacteroidia bacterium]|nr:DUF4258 domain-containing protein [Bacteroidia bacterium]